MVFWVLVLRIARSTHLSDKKNEYFKDDHKLSRHFYVPKDRMTPDALKSVIVHSQLSLKYRNKKSSAPRQSGPQEKQLEPPRL